MKVEASFRSYYYNLAKVQSGLMASIDKMWSSTGQAAAIFQYIQMDLKKVLNKITFNHTTIFLKSLRDDVTIVHNSTNLYNLSLMGSSQSGKEMPITKCML